jgi:hypothetical protein
MRYFLVLNLGWMAACGGAVEPRTGCDPLDDTLCALPFPSSYFLSENAESTTGFQVDFGPTALPINRDDVPLTPTYWNEKDGFSTSTPILAFFPDVDEALLLSHTNLSAYASDTVSTVLVNAETGDRVPHFTELDYAYQDEIIVYQPHETLLHIYPVEPLDFGTRYVVGYRALKNSAGEAFAPSAAFAALRDDKSTDQDDIEFRREHFESVVFPTLSATGFAREDLQLAFDFVTVSRENSLGRVEWIRDDALARFGEEGPAYTLTEVEPETLAETLEACASGATIGRTLYGDMTVPLYTTEDERGAFLTRDAKGMPFYNGDTVADFMVRIPCSLITAPKAAPILQYGHGLLGSKDEAHTGHLSQLANDGGYVVVATDWKGMSDRDRGEITLMMAQDVSNFAFLPERSVQGFVEFMAVLHVAMKGLSQDEHLVFEDTNLIDPARRYYYGISQGGILGGAYMALSKDLNRGVLGVPGAPYALLLPRSYDFQPFFDIMTAKYDEAHDIELVMGLLQQLWDPAEAAGWLKDMNQAPGEGVEPKQILIQAAIGDAQVTTLGAHVMARAYGAKTVAPETRPIWGVEQAESGFEGSAIVEWFYPDGATEPVENLPPDHNLDTHECPRREPAAQAQIRDFFESGRVVQHCDGVCEGIRQGFCD